jgi:putative ABC transport system substrate-binding protein
MTSSTRRREFLTLLGGAAAAWPLAARAQQPVIRVVGFLHSGMEAAQRGSVDAFLQGLEDAGFVEGRNVALVFRWANLQLARVPALAADLVKRDVAVLVAAGGTVLRAKAATDTVPIVAIGSIDLVKWGVVASLSRPGGNVTGITFLSNQLMGKRLDFLRKMVPEATTIGFLTTTGIPHHQRSRRVICSKRRVRWGVKSLSRNAEASAIFRAPSQPSKIARLAR